MSRADPAQRRADTMLAAVLFFTVVAYWSYLPWNLGMADESYFLYEAKRIRDGDVMYRDIFQFITPLSSYAMAALFWLFGTTMATARIATAVVHGATAILLFATARRLSVRSTFAALLPLAYLAICTTAWPFASWHWFSTLATATLVFVLVTRADERRPAAALVPGLATALVIAVQHQKGAAMAVGVCCFYALDHAVDRRYGSAADWRNAAARIGFFAAGVLLIVIPGLLLFAVLAGPASLYDALIRFPLENYRGSFQIRWGAVAPLSQSYAQHTFPSFLRFLPIAMLLPALRGVLALRAKRDRELVAQRLALVLMAAFSAASIWYFPDTIHIAFIAGVFFVCAADGAEWLVSALGRPLATLVAPTGAVLIAAVLTIHLGRFAEARRATYPIAHDTEFGRLNFAHRWETVFIDGVRDHLRRSGSQSLFCYPTLAAPYLTTGGRNPTRFQFLSASVSPPEQIREALSTLRNLGISHVITSPFMARPNDPIIGFVRDHYESVSMPEIIALGELPAFALYSRAAEPVSAGH